MNDQTTDPIPDMPSCPKHWLAGRINMALPALATAFLASDRPKRGAKTERDDGIAVLPSSACNSIAVPPGNRLSCHVYALGVQIYRWNGTAWAYMSPEAMLFADVCHDRQIGILYAGPTWEADDGSKINGVLLNSCVPFRGAIPWVLLKATPTADPGTLSRVTFIQRINTIGGTAPSEVGAFVGDEARVPYTTEYYFYRRSK